MILVPNPTQEQGSALLESLIAMTLLLIVASGLVWAAWLLSLRSLVHALANETASVMAHQHVHSQTTMQPKPLAERLRQGALKHIQTHPLVPRWLGPRLGLRFRWRIENDKVMRSSLYLCIRQPTEERSSTLLGQRDCLGQFADPKSKKNEEGFFWIAAHSLHPAPASYDIIHQGLSETPWSSQRQAMVKALLPTKPLRGVVP